MEDSSHTSLYPKAEIPPLSTASLKIVSWIYLRNTSSSVDINPIRCVYLYSPSLHHLARGQGILTLCPSPPAFAIGLGPTNPSLITIAKETLIFRRGGISPPLRLLVPAFSLLYAPPWVTPLASLQIERSLTACYPQRNNKPSVSVPCFSPDYLRRRISR